MKALSNLLQTKAQLYSLALLIGCLLFVIPVFFMVASFSAQTELAITRSIGIGAAFSLLGISLSHFNRLRHWLYPLLKASFWLPLLFGLSLLLVLSGLIEHSHVYGAGFGVWLGGSLLCVIYLRSKEPKPTTSADSSTSIEIDEKELFSPALTNAIHLSLVKKVEHADKLPEFLFDRGIAVEILNRDIDGTLLLKLSRGGDLAYARLMNLSLLCLQGFFETKDTSLLPDNPLWNIEVAHMKGRTMSLSCDISSALAELLQHYPAQKAENLIVRRYQSLSGLTELAKKIDEKSHQRVLHMGFHAGDFELSTEALYGTLTWEQPLTLWVSSTGSISTESKLINEDITVSTPDVEVTPIPLPYESCKLTNIQLQTSEELAIVLYLTFAELKDGQETAEQITKMLRLAYGEEVLFDDATSIPDDLISVQEYLKREAIRAI